MVRCVGFLQSTVTCCRSESVRLEVFDGNMWQVARTWKGSDLPRKKFLQQLPVPITCTEGKPTGIGVVHDCDGPPVVGRQDGDTCTARCGDGYLGSEETYTCNPDGSFTGTPPMCYDNNFLQFIGTITGSIVGFFVLTRLYNFVRILGKPSLAYDTAMIPTKMQGHFHDGLCDCCEDP